MAGVPVSAENGTVMVDGHTVQLVGVSQIDDDGNVSLRVDDGLNESDPEPPMKRFKSEDSSPEQSSEQSIKQILFNINKAICLRLDSIESKLEVVTVRTKMLEDKVESMCSQMKATGGVNAALRPGQQGNRRSGAVIVGLPQERGQNPSLGGQLDGYGSGMRGKITVQVNEGVLDLGGSCEQGIQNLGPNVQLITLNTEDDFPHGTWLGDENNPEMRVRVPITASDLLHVHSNCRTPEKMALALLDYLFDRDTQASSNLSGMGKHGKAQLDPLMIYGIRCHLIHRFGVTEQDWHRIKQNIDSKCRTAFRRKMKGLPLTVKAFRGKAPPTYVHMPGLGHELNSDDSMQEEELHIHQMGEVDMQHHGILHGASAAEIIQSAAGGEIQVLHATPEQVAQLQQAHQIQILQGDHSEHSQITMLQGPDGQEGIQVAVSMAPQDQHGLQVVTTESGETIHITQDQDADGTVHIEPDEDQ